MTAQRVTCMYRAEAGLLVGFLGAHFTLALVAHSAVRRMSDQELLMPEVRTCSDFRDHVLIAHNRPRKLLTQQLSAAMRVGAWHEPGGHLACSRRPPATSLDNRACNIAAGMVAIDHVAGSYRLDRVCLES